MGQTWDGNFSDVPDGDDSPSTLDNAIRAHKEAVEERMENEHDTFEDATAGLASADWRHKEGSARAYYQAVAPTDQPGDNGAALGASDDGRIWVDSDIYGVRVFNGTAFVNCNTSVITTLNTGTSWTVPANIYRVKATIIGAGGGGGGCNFTGPGGNGTAGEATTFNATEAAGGALGRGSRNSGDGAAGTGGHSAGNGGGGAQYGNAAGTSGRGGEIVVQYFTVVPAAVIAYTLGAGGTGGTDSSYEGGDGGKGQVILEY